MTLEPILLLLNAYAMGKLAVFRFFEPFVRSGPNVLILFLVPLLAAVLYLVLVRAGDRRRERLGFWIVTGASLISIFFLANRQLGYRATEALPRTDNDGAVQSREAATFLLRGQNPYAADFATTPFAYFPSPAGPGAPNKAAQHYAYLPLQFLLMVPTVLVNQLFATKFDTQLLILVIFLLYVTAVVFAGKAWPLRTRLMLLTAGNAWLLYPTFAGFNDVVFVFFLSMTAIFATTKRTILSAAMLGLALASKQTAWLTVPLWVAYWYQSKKARPGRWWRPLVVTGAVAGAIILPFWFWNPGAFFDDTVRYVSGAIPGTYPISGSTFLQYLRPLGVVTTPWATFPSWPLQLFALSGLSWLGWRSIRQNLAPSNVLTWSVATILSVLLVSKFAPDNYIFAIIELAIAAYAVRCYESWQAGQQEAQRVSPDRSPGTTTDRRHV